MMPAALRAAAPAIGPRHVIALLCAVAAAAGIAGYPLMPGWVGLGLAGYALVLWLRPAAWLVLLPALLPIFDLAPWSGRFYFDEGDFLVLTTAAALYLRLPLLRRPVLPSRLAGAAVLLLAVVLAVSTARGLLPLAPLGDNAFNSYFSPYNGLRVAKGLAWALLLLPALAQAMAAERQRALGRLCLGYLAGLAGVTAFALRERWVFTGLFDFDLPFRVTSTFSSMHLGGGAIAAFLALTLPLLALPFVGGAGRLWRLAALGLLAAAGYVLIVTFSRAAYLGAAAGFVVLLAALPAAAGPRQAARFRRAGVLALVAVAVAAVVTLVLPGSYAAARFDLFGRDLENRLWEWREGLELADKGPLAMLLGTGLGSYPRDFLTRNTDGRVPTTFSIEREGERSFLHLGSGESLYVGQRVALRPATRYRLSVDFRASSDRAELAIPVCEKTLLYSAQCGFASFVPARPGEWERHELEIDSGHLGRRPGLRGLVFGRPIDFSLYNPYPATALDIDRVALVALDGPAAGTDLLSNGDFARGTDRWFFAPDNLATWRIENMWLMTFFEQGVLGVAALGFAVMTALVGLLRRISVGPAAEAGPAAVLLASLGGYLTVGLAHGLVDAPRPMTMFYLLLFAAICYGRRISDASEWAPSSRRPAT